MYTLSIYYVYTRYISIAISLLYSPRCVACTCLSLNVLKYFCHVLQYVLQYVCQQEQPQVSCITSDV